MNDTHNAELAPTGLVLTCPDCEGEFSVRDMPDVRALLAERECAAESVRVGFRYQDGEILSPEREARSEDIELPVAVIDLGDGEWLTLGELRDLHAERLEIDPPCGPSGIPLEGDVR